MNPNNIGLYEEISKIIHLLSSNSPLILPSAGYTNEY